MSREPLRPCLAPLPRVRAAGLAPTRRQCLGSVFGLAGSALLAGLPAPLQAGPRMATVAPGPAPAGGAPPDDLCGPQAAEATEPPRTLNLRLSDVALVDQDGRTRRLLSEVLAERITVVGFVYTSCTTVCPLLTALLAELQVDAAIGPRLGRDLGLLSLSIDPQRDTPARLKAYAERHRAGAGWTWLTGPPLRMEQALKAFGVWTTDPAAHAPVTLVGDARQGRWLRHGGLPTPAQLAQSIAALSRLRATGAAGPFLRGAA